MPTDTAHYFDRWEHTYPGQFLTRDADDQLVIDVSHLIDLMPNCSTGEQVYAAIWYECFTGRRAPWLDEGASALALLGILDLDLRADAVAHISRTFIVLPT